MTFTPKFELKQEVFIKADEAKELHYVVSYTILQGGVIIYNLSGYNGAYAAYEFEIAEYELRSI